MNRVDLAADAARVAVRRVTVNADEAPIRLDRFLVRQWPDVPKSHIFRSVRRGEVRVNGRRVGPQYRLQAGDQVRLPPIRVGAGFIPNGRTGVPREPLRDLIERVASRVLFEDRRLLVVDKPAGLAVHGGSGIAFGVIEALRASRPGAALELVHRLDRDTSGVLLIARHPAMLRALHAQLRGESEAGRIDKRYLVLVRGRWSLGHTRIDAPLRTDRRVAGERTVRVAKRGKISATMFRPLQFFGTRATLLEAQPQTGRTHQIRVHAAYAGYPVAGDPKYGDAEFNRRMAQFGLRRLFLHAASISLTRPDNGAPFAVNAPLPDDLRAVLDALGAGHVSGEPRRHVAPVTSAPVHRTRSAGRSGRSAANRSPPSGRASRPPRAS
ncbi:MAG: RluA family pseudouridine synthase [Steroidobacteraceae bacterium]|nr:RluA family pseudouridine synthase [Steroidobacteraceae bacterium]MDW8259643.1 RluA family pseudouridine synthase [Gammaproteobacteria bacterium]